jgi:NADPH:quinone reductase-like Zn-dependent oxidoreductase
MRAWQCAAPGPIETAMKLVDNAVRPSADKLKPGQIIVRVASVSLNPADYKTIAMGIMSRLTLPWPKTVSMDLAGHATAVASDVTGISEGDVIMGRLNPLKGAGSLAEYVLLDRECYTRVPNDTEKKLDLDHIAGAPTAALTEYQAIKPYVKPGDRVFINGGAGGIGTFGIQIAKALGCRVTTTCSTQKVGLCKELGADEVIDYKTEPDLVARLTPKAGSDEVPFTVAVDNVGDRFEELYKAGDAFLRADGGRYTVIGLPMSLGAVRGIMTSSLRPALLGGGKRAFSVFATTPNAEDMRVIVEMMAEGKVRTVVDSTFEFEQAVEAFERLKTGSCTGKVIVRVAPRE